MVSKYLLFLACKSNDTELITECIENGYNLNERNIAGQTPLMVLIKERGWLTNVKLLVEHGAAINSVDYDGNNVLHYIDCYRQVDVKKYLNSQAGQEGWNNNKAISELKIEIKNGQIIPTNVTKEVVNTFDGEGFTPFMWSIWFANLNHFNYYIVAGADINLKNPEGKTPLMIACYKLNFDIVKRLLNKGALINELDNFGNSAIAYLMPLCAEDDEIILFLFHAGANMNLCGRLGKTPLIWSAIYKKPAKYYFHFSVFYPKLTYLDHVNYCDFEGNTALAYTAYNGHVNIAEKLFDINTDVKIDLCEKKARTPLAWAITGNNFAMFEYLLKRKANIHQIDFHGNTALSYARRYKRLEMIERLVKNDAIDPNQHPLTLAMKSNQFENYKAILKNDLNSDIPELQTTPLCLVVKNNKLDFVKLLIENGANCCQKDQNGNAPLILAILHYENNEIIKCLLENGGKATIQSAFSAALETENVEIIKLLIENSAKVNKTYKDKGTPIMYAIKIKNEDIFKLLLESGASPNTNEDPSPLVTAINLKYFTFIKHLIEQGANTNEDSDEKLSPLQSACKLQLFDVIKLLVEKGAAINCSNSNKFQSPLRTVILLNNCEISKCLIENGANVCEIYKDEKSLLQLAVENKNAELVKILVEKNSEILKIQNQHASPLRRAIELNHLTIGDYLIKKGANVNEIDETNPEENLLQLAINNKNVCLIMLLIQYGVDIEANRTVIEEYAQQDSDFEEFFNDFKAEKLSH